MRSVCFDTGNSSKRCRVQNVVAGLCHIGSSVSYTNSFHGRIEGFNTEDVIGESGSSDDVEGDGGGECSGYGGFYDSVWSRTRFDRCWSTTGGGGCESSESRRLDVIDIEGVIAESASRCIIEAGADCT